ncbi:MAG: amidohydrolase, partial [Actinobacteria bacterium]|nr:amidohydrolase [Actinomycetota bacterium]
MDAARTQAEAVAIRDGRILAVGSDSDINEHIGPRTEVIGLRDRMLLPGFIDCHSHAPKAGMDKLRVDMSELTRVDEYLSAIGRFARERPDVEWILGGGWVPEAFPDAPATAAILDTVVHDRPAAFSDADNHRAWANSRALELAGIDRSTTDPRTGRIDRTADGSPSGTLHEGAVWLLRRAIPTPDAEEVGRAILLAQEEMHSLGFTGWQDAIVGDYQLMPNTVEVYPVLASREELTARVTGNLWWSWYRGLEQVVELVELRERSSIGRYRAATVKIMQDGTAENRTAGLLQPYLDDHGHPSTDRGLSMVDPDELKSAVTALDAAGFQVHLHTIGDRAVREALDAVQAAREANGMRDTRHHLSHVQLVHPDDVPRFRRLRASATIQTLWACLDPLAERLTIPAIGMDRVAVQFPFQTLVRSGARIATGSD